MKHMIIGCYGNPPKTEWVDVPTVIGCPMTARKLRVLKRPLKHPKEYGRIEKARKELWAENRKVR